jgi:PAS domain S-box-containing protein
VIGESAMIAPGVGSPVPSTADATDGAGWRRPVVVAVIVGMSYYIGARIGFAFQSPSSPQSILWLPNSSLLAAMLVVPPRHWWMSIAASFPAQLITGWESGAPMTPIALLFVTNCTDAMLGAALLRYRSWEPWRFDGLTSMLRFVALAAVLAPVVVSFADAGITVLTDWGPDYRSALVTRIRANVLTNVILVPAVVSALSVDWRQFRAISTRRLVEAGALLVGLSLVANYVYSAVSGSPFTGLLVMPLPFLIWAAVRFGPGITGTGLFIVAILLSHAATNALGPFEFRSTSEAIDAVQLVLIAMSLSLLILAAVVQDLHRTTDALGAREREAQNQLAQVSAIYGTAPVGLGFLDRELRYVRVNDRLAELHGVPASAHTGRTLREVLPDMAPAMEPLLRDVIDRGVPIVDSEVINTIAQCPRKGGSWLVSYYPVVDNRSSVFGVSILVQDITERKRGEVALGEAQMALRASYERIRDLAGRLIATQEAERKRIARELHDDVNQRLAALSIALSGLRRVAGDSPRELREGLARVQQQTIAVTGDIRDLSHELHSSVLQHAGLVAALRSACQDLGRHHGVEVDFRGGDVGTIPDDVSLCLYRVGQEALRNMVEHADATHAVVDLARSADRIELTIADDGRGFDVAGARRRGGLGLISIEERVRMARGTVVVDSAPANGTRVRVSLPVEA